MVVIDRSRSCSPKKDSFRGTNFFSHSLTPTPPPESGDLHVEEIELNPRIHPIRLILN